MTAAELNGNSISILNDDCIFRILELLSLCDLCRISQTCKRLQVLCENQFLRKYPNEAAAEVRIGIGFDGKLRTRHYEYVKCFHNFVKQLTICVWNFGPEQCADKQLELSPVVNFVKTKCDWNLYKICVSGEIALVPLCNEIETFLRNVEIVEFAARRKSGRDEATFLQHCPNVTTLILVNPIYVGNASENVDAILEQKYHQLKHFYFMYGDALSLNAEKLKIFFQRNGSIESLALSFDFYVDPDLVIDRDNCTVKCIETLNYAVNLQNLFLSVGAPLTNCFGNICNNLSVLCDRDNFKSLELEFVLEAGAKVLKSNATKLAALTQLTKIHLKCMPLGDVLAALQPLAHLKIIVLHNPCLKYNHFVWSDFGRENGLTENATLPQVEEIQIECTKGHDFDVLHHVEQFSKHWMHLQRILLPDNNTTFDIAQLNRERDNLLNACELTIFTNQDGSPAAQNHALVNLKYAKFVSDSVTSPFQRCRMSSRQ